jgi:hypothetical protein
MIQINTAFTGMVNDPAMRYFDSFMEKSRYAASIGKPMYLFINGKEKYPLAKLRAVIRLPWRKIFILPYPYTKSERYYDNEIVKDASLYNLIKRL